jgi:hypothetical protein
MSRLMHQSFAAELTPWHQARSTGVTLEQHVIRTTLQAKPPTFDTWSVDGQPTAVRPPAHPPRARVARSTTGYRIRIAALLVAFGLGYLVAHWWLSG